MNDGCNEVKSGIRNDELEFPFSVCPALSALIKKFHLVLI